MITNKSDIQGLSLVITNLLAMLSFVVSAQDININKGDFTATSTVLEIMGESHAQSFAEKISITDPIEWEVYVPENYSPDVPAGILVFINSRDSGMIEEMWKEVMEDTNLIYIGANGSGNQVAISKRVAYAIIAPRLLSQNYNIDPNRIYLSGFSGGSRVASLVATEYNDLFNGAIYNSGANDWGDAAKPRYDEMKDNHYVFITGTEDFNLDDTKTVYNAYKKVGINNSKLIVMPDTAHKRPTAEVLTAAILHLDSRLTK